MQNLGEEIAGEYLKHFKHCEFIEYNLNLNTPGIQGEIDVVGINLKKTEIYICEVAVHVQGLGYVAANGQPDNVYRLMRKFLKDIDYANKYYADYKPHFMLWSPIVKSAGTKAKNNPFNDVKEVKRKLRQEHGYDLELIVNNEYQKRLKELRKWAGEQTKELKSPVLRMMQIEETLKRHLKIQP